MSDTLQNYADTLRNQTKAIQEDLSPKEQLKEKALDAFGSIGETLAVDSGEGIVKSLTEKVKDTLKKKGGQVGEAVGQIIDEGQKGGLKGVVKSIGQRVGKQPRASVEPRMPDKAVPKPPKSQTFKNPAFETYNEDAFDPSTDFKDLESKIKALVPSKSSLEIGKIQPVEEDIGSTIKQRVKTLATAGKTEPGASVLGDVLGEGEGKQAIKKVGSILGDVGGEVGSVGIAGALGGLGKGTLDQKLKSGLKQAGQQAGQDLLEAGKDEVKSRLKKAALKGGEDFLKTEAGESEIGGFLDPVADIVGLGVGLGGLIRSLVHKPTPPHIDHINSSFQVGL
tara:strand:- start:995 stop:2005 length:1011 start_codon:yes stop_codon:yes gene_type:complete